HTVTAALYPERPAASIGHIVISLNSYNSFAESDDNWNVQSVSAALLNNGTGRMPLMSASGAPLDRLTSSHPRLTLPQAQNGPPGPSTQFSFSSGPGGDYLRGDISPPAVLQTPNGSTLQTLTLKDQKQAGWNNNSTHTVSLPLNPPLKACDIGHIVISL